MRFLVLSPWGVIKGSIFGFPNFGAFSELLVNSVLLSASKMRKVITELLLSFDMEKVITHPKAYPFMKITRAQKISCYCPFKWIGSQD